MANSIADILSAKLNTTEKSNVVSAVNEVNNKTIEHSGNAALHVTSDEKSKIASIKDGTTSVKGLIQLSDAVNSTSTSLAATANAVKKAYDLANTANNKTYTPPTSSTSAAGIVQLNDAVNSTSTTQAATANAVKKAYDLANGKYSKPSSGIAKSDLASDVQASLSKADAAAIHQNEDASLTKKGHVQLSSAINSTSETLAATPKAVKTAYDLANQAKTVAENAGGELVVEKFDTPGTHDWTVPKGVTKVYVSMCGGGAGGSTLYYDYGYTRWNGSAGGISSFGQYVSVSGGSAIYTTAATPGGHKPFNHPGDAKSRPGTSSYFSYYNGLTVYGYGYGGTAGGFSSESTYAGGGGASVVDYEVILAPNETQVQIIVGSGGAGATTTQIAGTNGGNGASGCVIIKYVK